MEFIISFTYCTTFYFVFAFLHHSLQVRAGFNQGNNRYEIHTLTEYKKGKQVFINYGPHDNRKLLIEYGFILPKNLHNAVTFSQDLVYSVAMPEICGVSRKKEIIAVNQLEKDLSCSEENELSWNVLTLLRILAMNEEDVGKRWQRTLTGEFQDEGMERTVRRWRQQLILKVLECYEEADNFNGNDCLSIHSQQSLNMELALELRFQEKQILKNALKLAKVS